MNKDKFNNAELESMDMTKLKLMFGYIRDGYNEIGAAQIAYRNASNAYEQFNRSNYQIYSKIDMTFFNNGYDMKAIGLSEDYRNRFNEMYKEFLIKYEEQKSINEKLYLESEVNKEAISVIRTDVMERLSKAAKSLGFTFYRRINKTTTEREILDLLRMIYKNLFVRLHSQDGTKFTMNSSDSMYINNKLVELYSIESITNNYNIYIN